MRAGASGFVTKEKEVTEIADAVRSVFRGHLVIPVDLAAGFLQDISDADLTQSLTEIQTEILASFVRGETNREIAAAMHLSERTVSRRIDELYQKLHFSDRIQAAIWASQRGIGTPKGNGD
jgi:DNA-binding NarL/FixJ family response regulator